MKRDYDRLDLLVNNAGIATTRSGGREVSTDGHELMFAVNDLAGYLLTYELLPLLRAGAPARIVNVSSGGQAPIDFDNVMLERDYEPFRAYAQSKLAQIMFTIDLAAELEGTGVTTSSLHPAAYMGTNMIRTLGLEPQTSVEEAPQPSCASRSGTLSRAGSSTMARASGGLSIRRTTLRLVNGYRHSADGWSGSIRASLRLVRHDAGNSFLSRAVPASTRSGQGTERCGSRSGALPAITSSSRLFSSDGNVVPVLRSDSVFVGSPGRAVPAEPIAALPGDFEAFAWLRDGRVFGGLWDTFHGVALHVDTRPLRVDTVLTNTGFLQPSPDGRGIAYNPPELTALWIEPLPRDGRRFQVATGTVDDVRWLSDSDLRSVRRRTAAKGDSMALVVRRWCQCSFGKSK